MTKNINIQEQGGKFYIHFDTNAMRSCNHSDYGDAKMDCFDIELSKQELEELKQALK